MGIMRTLFDYAMTGDWEKTQRIQLYKKLGKCDILPPINGCGLLDLEGLHQSTLSTIEPLNHYSYPSKGFRDTFNSPINSSNRMHRLQESAALIPQKKNKKYINLSVRSHPTSKECGVSRSQAKLIEENEKQVKN